MQIDQISSDSCSGASMVSIVGQIVEVVIEDNKTIYKVYYTFEIKDYELGSSG